MSPTQLPEKPREWTSRTYTFETDAMKKSWWGIDRNLLFKVSELLPDEGLVTKKLLPGTLPFSVFRKLIQLLHSRGYDTAHINEAINMAWEAARKQPDMPPSPAQQKGSKQPQSEQAAAPSEEDVFRQKMNSLDASIPVKDPRNTQRGRWGGKSRVGDAVIRATVTKGTDGLYHVVAHLSCPNATWVGVFLPQGYGNVPIRVIRLDNHQGEVAFLVASPVVIGACTNLDTRLELDLNDVAGFSIGLYTDKGKTFKDIVENLYATQPITVPDDLQRSRWGGQDKVNGTVITAEVSKSVVPNFFQIHLKISSSLQPLTGDVAWFLHNSFPDEIKCKKIQRGEAHLRIQGYEAFTVGAYLADGTMLELDLNTVNGAPRDFYYHDPVQKFKESVESIYKSQPIVVEGDLQKNRWGGRSTRRGKALTAAVKSKLVPRLFDVKLEVKSTTTTALTGFVAFFLHDTFKPAIKYRKVIDGTATLNVTAYEAFTVAACTEDGTTLELDLNKVSGLPPKFYY